MAPLHKQLCENFNNDKNDERRRGEKRQCEDNNVVRVDAHLKKDEHKGCREKLRVQKATEDAHMWAAVAEYIMAWAWHNEDDGTAEATTNAIAGSSTGLGTRERAEVAAKEPVGTQGKEKEQESKGWLHEVPCLSCIQRNLDCHSRVVKGARTCWECKQWHLCCRNGTGGFRGAAHAAPLVASVKPLVATTLGGLATQVFDLLINSLNQSSALLRLEHKINVLACKVAWIAEVMGLPEELAAWQRKLNNAEAAVDEMEVNEVKALLTSNMDNAPDTETTGMRDKEEEEEQVDEESGGGEQQ